MKPHPAFTRFLIAAAGVMALASMVSQPRIPTLSLRVSTPSFQLSVAL